MNYLHGRIDEIGDADFHALIDELYHCVGWRRDDESLYSIWYLLSAINAQDPKALTAKHLPVKGLLTSKVDRLPDGAVADLCREIAALKRVHIESFDGKTVLSLLKTCMVKASKTKGLSRGELRHQAQTDLILRRRANGDL